MFGKPEWFSEKWTGRGLIPASWQGALYMLIWVGVLITPFLIFFLELDRVPEAFLWLAFALAILLWDVKTIRKAIRYKAAGDVFVIDDSTDASQLHTANYDMHLRDES